MLAATNLSALCGLRHGFLTRRGGVSTGLYSSLNTGFSADDSRENVLENRRRALHRIGANSACLITGQQTHSTTVHIVQNSTESPCADALVTNQPQIALGVLAADCGPVLFADPHDADHRYSTCRLARSLWRNLRRHSDHHGTARGKTRPHPNRYRPLYRPKIL